MFRVFCFGMGVFMIVTQSIGQSDYNSFWEIRNLNGRVYYYSLEVYNAKQKKNGKIKLSKKPHFHEVFFCDTIGRIERLMWKHNAPYHEEREYDDGDSIVTIRYYREHQLVGISVGHYDSNKNIVKAIDYSVYSYNRPNCVNYIRYYFYDEFGNLCEEICYWYAYSINFVDSHSQNICYHHKKEYIYNTNNQLKEELVYTRGDWSPNINKPVLTIHKVFDENNRLVEKKEKNNMYFYEYDLLGNLIQMDVFYISMERLICMYSVNYLYDENGHVTLIQYFDTKDNITKSTEYKNEYDDKNNLINTFIYGDNKLTGVEKITIDYY